MNAILQRRAHSIVNLTASLRLTCAVLALSCLASPSHASGKPMPGAVKVNLSEWKVQLTPARVPPGPVVFEVRNDGTIPHAFEVEGHGLEKSIPKIKPGTAATLKVDLRAGSYEAYCPVGKGSHKMLGMMNHLMVGNAKRAAATDEEHEKDEKYEAGHDAAMEHAEREHGEEYGGGAKMTKVAGGGPVIQILPGPFPFADGDWALDCCDCSDRPIAELQLQVTPAPNTQPSDAPGGFLSVNWERSSGQRVSLQGRSQL
jgi:hypothetical protein